MFKKSVIFNISPTTQSTGGISRYCSELYKHINDIDEFDIRLFPTQIKKKSVNSKLRILPYAYLLRQKYNNYVFKNFVKKNHEAELYHETNYILNDFDKQKILTVYDLAWVHFPDFHPKERVNFMLINCY